MTKEVYTDKEIKELLEVINLSTVAGLGRAIDKISEHFNLDKEEVTKVAKAGFIGLISELKTMVQDSIDKDKKTE